jgi:alcohol dehydrogenase class IV
MDYKFYMPTLVENGIGISNQIGEKMKALKATKVLIVTDKGIRNANILSGIEQSLRQQDIAFEIFDEVEPNPSAETIHRGLAVIQSFQADAVIGIGGGSSMDAAKAIAALATNEGHVLDYAGVNKVVNPPLTIVAIPTTSGTGSEVTAVSVVTNKETQFKAPIFSPYLFPKLAILDPLLTVKLPPAVTAATGMDALTHAIESYTCKNNNPLSAALALEAIRIIANHIHKAYYVGDDLESREKMLEASMIAGVAFSQTRLGNVHAISHTLGGVYDIPHGIANAALLPYVMKYNLPACPEKYQAIAVALGQDISGLSVTQAGQRAIDAILEMNRVLHIPSNIKDLGVSLQDIGKLVDDSMLSGNILINPRLTKASDIQAIIEDAYHGNMA